MSQIEDFEIRVAKESDIHKFAEMFVEISNKDPFYRALFREDDKYLDGLYIYLKEWAIYAIKHHQVFIAGDFIGGAIILPPYFGKISLSEQLGKIKSTIKIFSIRKMIPSIIELNSVISENPNSIHYYLFLIGHRPGPNFSHKGIATALINPTLKECNRLEIPCYAEFTSKESAEWGIKLGFKIYKEKPLPFHNDVIIRYGIWEPRRTA